MHFYWSYMCLTYVYYVANTSVFHFTIYWKASQSVYVDNTLPRIRGSCSLGACACIGVHTHKFMCS